MRWVARHYGVFEQVKNCLPHAEDLSENEVGQILKNATTLTRLEEFSTSDQAGVPQAGLCRAAIDAGMKYVGSLDLALGKVV